MTDILSNSFVSHWRARSLAQNYGTVLAEVGRVDEAIEVLKKAIAVEPDTGHEKFMYLSQLTDGEVSIGYSRAGIEILRRCIGEEKDREYAAELKSQLCQALCALVEFMLNSSLLSADSPNQAAAPEALRLLDEAERSDPSSPEPWQVRSSLHVEQGRSEDARAALRKSLSIWYRKGAHGQGDGDGDGDDDGEGVMMDVDPQAAASAALPSYEFRFEAAKLVMELEDDARPALAILEGLLDESDANLDVWFLLALCNQGMAQLEEATECLDHIEQAIAGLPSKAPERENLRALRVDLERIKTEMAETERQRQSQNQ